jgi:vitamin B12 transporter
LTQLFVDFPSFGFFANPNLRPETSTGYDLGFEQPVAGGRLRFGATYFHNDLNDLIQATFTTYENIAQARTEGVEAFAAVALAPNLGVRGDYTYTRAIDATTGLELLRRPRHKASLTTEWNATDALLLSATVVHVSNWIDTDREGLILRFNAPGYTVVNLAANYKVSDQLTAFARIDNLFDEHYQNPTGFLRPGLGAFAGVRVSNF